LFHGALAALMFLLPAEARDRILSTVDFSMEKKQEQAEPPGEEDPPEIETEEEEEIEEVKVAKRKPAAVKTSQEKPADETPPPKPPPKFQMSGQTFASDGSWGLAAEVGDSRFGSLSGEGEYDKKADKGPVDTAPASTGPVGPVKKKGFNPAKPGEVKEKPKVLMEQQIPYPPEARKLGIEGKVRLRVDIDKKGRVVKVKVLKDPGGGLGKAAAKAIKGFVFSPAVGLNGKPVEYRITYTYVFELE
jgi:protein TonB